MIAAFGYILLGILFGAGVPYAFRVRKDWQREDREEALRDESWGSISTVVEDLAVAQEEFFSERGFEVVYPSRGA